MQGNWPVVSTAASLEKKKQIFHVTTISVGKNCTLKQHIPIGHAVGE